jgi:hypothetical protein
MFVELVIGACIFGAGAALGLIFQYGIHRRLYRLECEQADLETDVLSEKRKRAVGSRGVKEQQLELLAHTLLNPKQERYANEGSDLGLPGEYR